MSVCPLCSLRKAKRLCPVQGERICSLCCVERRRRDDSACPGDCPHNAKAREVARARVQAVTRRFGTWLSRRVRAFGAEKEVFTAGMDLEEALCSFSLVRRPLTDGEVLEALEFLSAVSGPVAAVTSPPNGLARWLREALEKGASGPLASLASLAPAARKGLLEKVLLLARGESRAGGYLRGLEAFFQDLRRAEGKDSSWFRKKAGGGREERGGVVLG